MKTSEEEIEEHSDFLFLCQITEVLIVCNAEAFHQLLHISRFCPQVLIQYNTFILKNGWIFDIKLFPIFHIF